MSHYTLYKLLGYFSILIGVCATLCIFKLQNLFYGIALAIPGFVVSGINIYMNTRYYSEEEKWPKGYLGMFFSSLPVLFILFVVFKFQK